jgi:hypothetical protein
LKNHLCIRADFPLLCIADFTAEQSLLAPVYTYGKSALDRSKADSSTSPGAQGVEM